MKTRKSLKLNQTGFGYVETVGILFVLALIGGVGWAVYQKHHPKHIVSPPAVVKPVSAATVINEFNQAMGAGNQTKVLSLESAAMKNGIENGTKTLHTGSQPVTNNFYLYCSVYIGKLCTYNFASSTLANAKVATSSYKNPVGVKGTTETFTITTTDNNADDSGSSTSSFGVSVVPDGNTWLVDYVNMPNASLTL